MYLTYHILEFEMKVVLKICIDLEISKQKGAGTKDNSHNLLSFKKLIHFVRF